MFKVGFFHGWAFDSKFFNKLKKHLLGFEFIDFDRGYFGKKNKNDIQKLDIAITHSMGLWHFVDSEIKADKVFAICGFESFCVNIKQRSVVQAMLDNIKIGQLEVLSKFFENIGVKTAFKSVNFELLVRDLELLKTQDYSEKLSKYRDKIVFINAKFDKIVYNKPLSDVEFNCGHALGFLKAKEVSDVILKNINV